MNATNNGYLGFDNVHIPREQMLMKNAQVLEVRITVIIWGWYRIMPVMQIFSMHRHCLHTHAHTHNGLFLCGVYLYLVPLAWPLTFMFLGPHSFFVFVCKPKSLIYLQYGHSFIYEPIPMPAVNEQQGCYTVNIIYVAITDLPVIYMCVTLPQLESKT